MKAVSGILAVSLLVGGLPTAFAAIDLDVTPQDIERALAIARGTERDRASFHAPYINALNTPFVERVEVVSEFRRVVLLAEEHIRKGDRMFSYSATQAQKAVAPWKRRVSIVARLRFHPQNNYVGVPPVDIVLLGREGVRIGVLKEPVLALPSAETPGRQAVLGAVVEGVFDAETLGDVSREFTIRLEKNDLATVKFDLGGLQ